MNPTRTTEQLKKESRLLRRAIRNLETVRRRRGNIEHFVEELRDQREKLRRAIATIEKVRVARHGAGVRGRV